MIGAILQLVALGVLIKLFIEVGKRDDGSVPFFLDE